MSYIFLLLTFVIILLFIYYYIRIINRDTYELETQETESISNEFVDNIDNFNNDLIRKYISDMKLETRIKEVETEIETLKSELNKKPEVKELIVLDQTNKIDDEKLVDAVDKIETENKE
ncbi:hypothetical protein AMV168 [Betaentomopoxvirus amoorei]|uniref:AMV168 n=1 Tax=Amsacta moorei entomopoxvirus TaxID=28321 RepID=Q9EMN1_AMEPV|nr:hypothetical protein AMV168 [Amsacta moorei entomopoxvirus]AAG02874.1 AMV168 [Amsacta moorei entomopoxvirus]